jgi:hypothetical protein
MSNLTSTLVNLLGVNVILPAVEAVAIDKLSHDSRPAIERTIEIPESVVDQLVHKTGADKATVMAKRAELGAAWSDFVLAFVPASAAE